MSWYTMRIVKHTKGKRSYYYLQHSFRQDGKRVTRERYIGRSVPKDLSKREHEEIAIAFTYNTNAIEGSTITLPETRSIIADKVAPAKPLTDVKETEAH